MRVLAVGFAAYVAAIVALSAIAVYLLLPLAAGMRVTDPPAAVALVAETLAPPPAPVPQEPPPGESRDTPAVAETPPAATVSAPAAEAPPASATVVADVEMPAPVATQTAAAPIVDEVVAVTTAEPAPEPEIEWSRIAKLDRLVAMLAAAHEPEAVPPPAPPDIAVLLQRGDALLATGDVASARLFYGRAAEHGDAAGALGVAKTYDPLFLAEAGFRTARGDPQQATAWYRRARDAGRSEAAPRLERLLAATTR